MLEVHTSMQKSLGVGPDLKMVMFSGTAHRSHRYIVAWSSGDTATCGTQACLCPATRRKTRVFSIYHIYLPPQLFSWVLVNNSDTFRFLQVSTGFNRWPFGTTPGSLVSSFTSFGRPDDQRFGLGNLSVNAVELILGNEIKTPCPFGLA